jgi:plasmid stabilization system protein ParE
MEIKILWSDSALGQLEEIYDFHKIQASYKIARNLVKSIVQKVLILETNPLLGVKEPLLLDRSFEYRYLIYKNYKIIYRYAENLVKINLVFDCRQNPIKMDGMKD